MNSDAVVLMAFVLGMAWSFGIWLFLRVLRLTGHRSFKQVAGDNSTQIQVGDHGDE